MVSRKFFSALAFTTLAALGASGAASGESVLRVAMTAGDLPDWTGQPSQGFEGYRFVGFNLYDALIDWDLSNPDKAAPIKPGLALSWEMDPQDKKKWILKLRQGVKFHDGCDWNADVAKWNIVRMTDEKSPQFNAAQYARARSRTNNIDHAEVVDPYTLAIYTKQVDPVFYYNLAYVFMISQCQLEKDKNNYDEFAKHPSGTGPYMFSAAVPRQRLEFVKNPNYWDKDHVQLTQVTYLPVEDENTDVKLFQSGDNDMTYQLPTGSYAKYRQQFPNDTRNSLVLGTRYYSFNNRDPLLKDVRVRKALSMVIDRDLLAQRVTADGQTPLYGLLPKGVSGADVSNYEWATWPMAKRVEEAKKLLEQAGVKPGTKLRFAMNTSDYNKKMAIFAASEWKTKLGLATDIESMEFKVLLKKRHDGDYQIARNGWVADYNDATTFLQLVQCKSTQNDNFNCSPKADALIQQASETVDQAKRKQLLTEAAKLVMEDYPMLPLLQYGLPRLVKSYVGGYSLKNPMDHYGSKDLYIVKH
jgi:oligopeptide transport system substrate-binding protein